MWRFLFSLVHLNQVIITYIHTYVHDALQFNLIIKLVLTLFVYLDNFTHTDILIIDHYCLCRYKLQPYASPHLSPSP